VITTRITMYTRSPACIIIRVNVYLHETCQLPFYPIKCLSMYGFGNAFTIYYQHDYVYSIILSFLKVCLCSSIQLVEAP